MSETTQRPKQTIGRRMLAALGLGTTAAAATLIATQPAQAMTPPGTKGAARYKETAHVKQYYATNRY